MTLAWQKTVDRLRRDGERWLEAQWYDSAGGYALRPAAYAFSGLARLRRWAYGKGVSATTKLAVPVIVVGNLTVGGTGKTPLTIWLVELLRDAGFKPGIISRGYAGSATRTEPLWVRSDSEPSICGDEPLLLALRTQVPVMVGRDRVAAVMSGLPSIRMAPVEATYLAWLDIRDLKLAHPAAHFEAHGLGLGL